MIGNQAFYPAFKFINYFFNLRRGQLNINNIRPEFDGAAEFLKPGIFITFPHPPFFSAAVAGYPGLFKTRRHLAPALPNKVDTHLKKADSRFIFVQRTKAAVKTT